MNNCCKLLLNEYFTVSVNILIDIFIYYTRCLNTNSFTAYMHHILTRLEFIVKVSEMFMFVNTWQMPEIIPEIHYRLQSYHFFTLLALCTGNTQNKSARSWCNWLFTIKWNYSPYTVRVHRTNEEDKVSTSEGTMEHLIQ